MALFKKNTNLKDICQIVISIERSRMAFELVSLKSVYNIYLGKLDISESHYHAPLRKLTFMSLFLIEIQNGGNVYLVHY